MADPDLTAIQARLDRIDAQGFPLTIAGQSLHRDIRGLLAMVERYRELIVQLEAENANQAAELAFWKDEEPHPSQLVHNLAGVDGYEGCRGGACVCTEDEG